MNKLQQILGTSNLAMLWYRFFWVIPVVALAVAITVSSVASANNDTTTSFIWATAMGFFGLPAIALFLIFGFITRAAYKSRVAAHLRGGQVAPSITLPITLIVLGGLLSLYMMPMDSNFLIYGVTTPALLLSGWQTFLWLVVLPTLAGWLLLYFGIRNYLRAKRTK